MTITVVKGPYGKLGEQVTSTPQNNNQNSPQNLAKAAQNAVVSRSVGSDAVVTTIRASRSAEKGERIDSYKKAQEVGDDVSERIRDNKDEAIESHQGLNSTSSREAFVS